jgi:hypothetical protein
MRMGDEWITRKVLNKNFHNTRPVGKTKKNMGARRPEGHITDPRNTGMEERSTMQ